MTHHPHYRPHIDGLRAIAVISVLFYHLGISWIPGGFVGVDIFFVISGFLISRIIFTDALSGNFSIATFYERRARRILPAFLVVTLLTYLGVFLIFLPAELVAFSESVIASVFFLPNIYFYMKADYFAPAAHTLPALHYWSLGVEEQFYFIFPLVIFAIVRRSRRLLFGGITVLLLTSLIASEAIVRTNPPAAFYLLPFRAYELLIGSFIALPGMRFPGSRSVGTIATFGGLALIIAALTLFSAGMRFPGFSALVPTLGAGLVLWGSDKTSNRAAKLLSGRVMVGIGKISYSLYLVHWPLILFANRLFPYANPVLRGTAVFAACIALAYVSYRFVETPFRRSSGIWTRRRIMVSALVSLATLTVMATLVIHFRGFPARFDTRMMDILAFEKYDLKPQFRSRVCFLELDQPGNAIDFEQCLPRTSMKKAILWGDSTAAHLYVGLRESLEVAGYSLGQLTASACPPLLGFESPVRPNCDEFNDIAFNRILKEKPDLLIMVGFWPVFSDNFVLDAAIASAMFSKLDATIAKVQSAGIRVVVLGAQPLYRIAIPTLIVERIKRGDLNGFSGEDLMPGVSLDAEKILKKHFEEQQNVEFVSIFDALCPENQCPIMLNNVTPLYFDNLHLTPEGSRNFAKIMVPVILD